jgi:MFS transporter, DHA1 family, inner membrane transport protein
MAFLGNAAVNRINLHYGFHALAQGAGGIFLLVFLLKAGVPLAETFLVLAGIVAGRFILRPMVLPFAKRFGLKPLVIFGAVVHGLQYLALAQIDGVDAKLFGFIAVSSIGDVFYWTCFHAYFSSLGDSEHRGHQISAREAVAASVGIVAPLLGAFALEALGPQLTFAMVAAVQVSGALPLLGTPNIRIPAEAPGVFRAARLSVALFAFDGFFAATYLLVWQVALFLALGESYSAYGGAMALAALVGAGAGLLLGRQIDAGRGQRAVLIAWLVAVSVTIMRASSLDWPELAVTANALGALVSCLLVPSQMTPVYNMAKLSPCVLRFHIAAEGGWDVGCFLGALASAALVYGDVSLAVAVLLALPAVTAIAVLLRGYYARNSVPIDLPVVQPEPGLLP